MDQFLEEFKTFEIYQDNFWVYKCYRCGDLIYSKRKGKKRIKFCDPCKYKNIMDQDTLQRKRLGLSITKSRGQ